jgi:hypothetical protein
MVIAAGLAAAVSALALGVAALPADAHSGDDDDAHSTVHCGSRYSQRTSYCEPGPPRPPTTAPTSTTTTPTTVAPAVQPPPAPSPEPVVTVAQPQQTSSLPSGLGALAAPGVLGGLPGPLLPVPAAVPGGATTLASPFETTPGRAPGAAPFPFPAGSAGGTVPLGVAVGLGVAGLVTGVLVGLGALGHPWRRRGVA